MSTQTGYPQTALGREIPTRMLWVTNPQPNSGQCYRVRQRQDGESFLPVLWPSCTCQELDHRESAKHAPSDSSVAETE